MKTLIRRTTKEDQKIALSSLKGFQVVSKRIKSSREKGVKIKVQETGEFITIPKKALTLLSAIIQNMAEGKTISIVPSNSEVSTQQAADMLNVSRPHLIKLLETKIIPFKKVGSHRRILLKDIIDYKEQLTKQREAQLDFLSTQAQDLKLGYE
ncbi:MAG: helix-turn-helix domain-containing protein [Cytophagales bacterium]|uniref:helix-turn-helix domain-containing protein n=1 Tax=Cyclobacterium marinum TaxID=104 RepID=UPI0030D9F2BF|nr:helix-turn-helix domain-containing protein [Cytophagales bacterium]|tara:strand:+ start:952 stop:1410 length:459 start_codon:yes stop_codon:yes gene_type:complete